jgi:hypothetical protein
VKIVIFGYFSKVKSRPVEQQHHFGQSNLHIPYIKVVASQFLPYFHRRDAETQRNAIFLRLLFASSRLCGENTVCTENMLDTKVVA